MLVPGLLYGLRNIDNAVSFSGVVLLPTLSHRHDSPKTFGSLLANMDRPKDGNKTLFHRDLPRSSHHSMNTAANAGRSPKVN